MKTGDIIALVLTAATIGLVASQRRPKPSAAGTPIGATPAGTTMTSLEMIPSAQGAPAGAATTPPAGAATPPAAATPVGDLALLGDDVVLVSDKVGPRLAGAEVTLTAGPVVSAAVKVKTVRDDGLLDGEIIRVTQRVNLASLAIPCPIDPNDSAIHLRYQSLVDSGALADVVSLADAFERCKQFPAYVFALRARADKLIAEGAKPPAPGLTTKAVSPPIPYVGFPRSEIRVVRRQGQVIAQTGTDATTLES